MPRRLLLTLALLASSPLAAPQDPPSTGPAPATEPTVFVHDFGVPGEHGFRVEFDRQGGSVRSVQLLDHYDVTDRRADERDFYHLAVTNWNVPGLPDRGFIPWMWLDDDAASPKLTAAGGGRIGSATWAAAVRAGEVVFTLDCEGGLQVEKRYAYEAGRRDLTFEIAIRNGGDAAAGQECSLFLLGLGVASPRSDYVFGNNPAYAIGRIVGGEAGEAVLTTASRDPAERPSVGVRGETERIDFAGSANRFFGAFLAPIEAADRDALYSVTSQPWPAAAQQGIDARGMPVAQYRIGVPIPATGEEARRRFMLYLGPKSNPVFDSRPEYERFRAVTLADLQQQPGCFCPIPGVQTMARFLMWLMGVFHGLVGNWGIAIMMLTLVVRGALVPVNFRMQKSMRAYGAKMQVLKPKLDEIQKRYADDRAMLQRKMVEFQRENKIFPPLGGCLPLFLTIPVFLGLFTSIRVSYELRQQPFFFWIDDLSRPDRLFELGWSWLPYFNLLPIIMVGLWWWLQSSTPLPTDPQQRQVMRIMRFMPLMFGVMLYGYGAGLMVYMITSSIFGLVEQRVTRRVLGPISPEAAAFGGTPVM